MASTEQISCVDVASRSFEVSKNTDSHVMIDISEETNSIGGKEGLTTPDVRNPLAQKQQREPFQQDQEMEKETEQVRNTGKVTDPETTKPQMSTKIPTMIERPRIDSDVLNKEVTETFSAITWQVTDDSSLGSGIDRDKYHTTAAAASEQVGILRDSDPFQKSPKENKSHRAKNADEYQNIVMVVPPGQLGFVFETSPNAPPLIHSVKETSLLVNKVKKGDQLIQMDGEDTWGYSATHLENLFKANSLNKSRRLVFSRRSDSELQGIQWLSSNDSSSQDSLPMMVSSSMDSSSTDSPSKHSHSMDSHSMESSSMGSSSMERFLSEGMNG